MSRDPLADLVCPVCGGPVTLQSSREQPLKPWQMRWQVVIGCCRTLQMDARTLESATSAAATYWPMLYGGKPSGTRSTQEPR